MATKVKNAIQFPAEDDFGDCPDATSDDVPSPEVIEPTSCTGTPAALVSASLTTPTLVNGYAGFTKETDKTRLKGSDRVPPPVVVCSDDRESTDDDDEEEEDEGFGNDRRGTEGQVSDRWKIEDGENIVCECFICNHTTSGYEAADSMKTHIESFHDLSFDKLKATFNLDYPSFVQFVRWAREKKEEGVVEESISNIWTLESPTANGLPWSSDKYLLPPTDLTAQSNCPVDYFLTLDFFAMDDKLSDVASGGIAFEDLVSEIERLKLDKVRMAEVFQRITSGNLDEEDEEPIRKRSAMNGHGRQGSTSLSPNGSPNKDRRSPKKSSPMQSHAVDNDSLTSTHNKWYFDSYDEVSIHHDMIFDKARTEAYRAAIIDRADDIKGKVVMDLGCGTGILSMFCAQQGAKVVHAVDKSNIIFDAMSNIFENNFDNTIKFHHKDLDNDDTTDLEKEGKVDVLVSEFMGYFLFFEGMTESFIRARNKYLKPDGVLMPDSCIVELAPVGPSGIYERKVRCWDTVYGLKMPALKDRTTNEPLMDIVKSDEIIGNRVVVKSLDLRTCQTTDIYICEDFEFVFNEDTEFCAVVGFFSVDFNGPNKKITLATSPWDEPTHWKQTVFFFPRPFSVTKGEKISGSIKSCNHKSDPRWLIVLLEFGGDKKFMYEIK